MLRATFRRPSTPSLCASAGTRGPMLSSSGGPQASQVNSAVAPRRPLPPPSANHSTTATSCSPLMPLPCVRPRRPGAARRNAGSGACNAAPLSRKHSSALKLLDERGGPVTSAP
ncbi:hypothetical protein PAHAL_1G038100 [Panicum hallii]|uniref:Uncharacterized protein n=1 Tax=Panicum hallii TaxID=206008 RepID=A0A2S3GLQ0_9POAL|nr:hypothetical protein PAHAL_1G038100 [Panicum hallii]